MCIKPNSSHSSIGTQLHLMAQTLAAQSPPQRLLLSGVFLTARGSSREAPAASGCHSSGSAGTGTRPVSRNSQPRFSHSTHGSSKEKECFSFQWEFVTCVHTLSTLAAGSLHKAMHDIKIQRYTPNSAL